MKEIITYQADSNSLGISAQILCWEVQWPGWEPGAFDFRGAKAKPKGSSRQSPGMIEHSQNMGSIPVFKKNVRLSQKRAMDESQFA